jgi:DNA-binding MarR family transcriptional regulator
MSKSIPHRDSEYQIVHDLPQESGLGTDIDYSLIEAMFFAYRDFIREPDQHLAALGLGRAHHRALHFVHRKPEITVAELLTLLQITKQSLNRVLSDLVTRGYIIQSTGRIDRRLRHLHTTVDGASLVERLARLQHKRLYFALKDPLQHVLGDPTQIRRAVLDFLHRVQDSMS